MVAAGEERVERRFLERGADRRAHLRPLADDVVAADPRSAGRRRQQRRQHQNGRRLARPVRAEEAVDLARIDVEVDPVDRPRPLLELADETLDLDRVRLLPHRPTLAAPGCGSGLLRRRTLGNQPDRRERRQRDLGRVRLAVPRRPPRSRGRARCRRRSRRRSAESVFSASTHFPAPAVRAASLRARTGERFETQTSCRAPSSDTRAKASTFSDAAFGSSQRKPVGREVDLPQRRLVAVDAVQVADERADARVVGIVEQVPVERARLLAPLASPARTRRP